MFYNVVTGLCSFRYCGRCGCERCNPGYRRKYERKVIERRLAYRKYGGYEIWNKKFELTFGKKGEFKATKENLEYEAACRKKLFALLRRYYHLGPYWVVREVGPLRGRLHLHVAAHMDYIPKRKLGRLAKKCGYGYVCWIRKLDRRQGIAYMTKYLLPDVDGWEWPKHARRVQLSRDEFPQPKPPSEWSFKKLLWPGAIDDKPRPATIVYWVLPEDSLPCRSAATTEPRSPPPPHQLVFAFCLPIFDAWI
jgi:hypothetical protein